MTSIFHACSVILNQKCCNLFINKYIFRNPACDSLLLSRMISFGVIFFSLFIKIPQIYQILHYKSGYGLSILALYIEITVNVVCICYHYQQSYAFTTYGEAYFVLLQNLIVAFFVSHFDYKYHFLSWDFVVIIEFTLLFSVVKNVAPPTFIALLWSLNIPLSLFYKFVQILAIKRKKCKGELSLATSIMKMCGSYGRIFTTYREISDKLVIFLYILNFILNAIVVCQCLKYPKKLEKDEPYSH